VYWGKIKMKTLKKNRISHNYTTETVEYNLLEKIKNSLKLNTSLNSPINLFKFETTEHTPTKVNKNIVIEVEIKRNQARTYANTIPPR